jgi:Outer membrane receptor for ferrienterochelin and colicins
MKQATPASLACALLCVVLHCRPVLAQELSEREFLTDFPTVLSASRLRQNIADAPQAVTVIDQETIRASGVRLIPELFRMVPGFNVSYSTRVKGQQPIVSYHGLGREYFSRLQVLIDGRSMNNATLGGVDWNDFPLALDDIERIEVVRGPSTASHGIGAFLGTINFITKHPALQRGTFATVNAGTNNILDGVARYAGGKDGFEYRITAEHQSDSGFANIADNNALNFATFRSDLQLTPIDSVMLQAGVTNRTSGVGTGALSDPSRNARFQTGYAQLKWERSLDADNGFYAQIYYYSFNLHDRFQTEPLPPFNDERFPLDDSSSVRRTDLEVQQNFTLGPAWRGVWGGSLREDVAEGPLLLRQAERLRVGRLFGHLEWRVTDAMLVNIGGMLENNDLTGTDVAPQVSVNYHVAPDHVIRLGVSKALRTPTLFEEKLPSSIIIGPPPGTIVITQGGLQPESIVATEVGYLGAWPQWRATLDVKAFYETLHNLIHLTNEGITFPPSPRTVVNGDDVRQWGIEGQFVWRPFPQSSVAISATHLQADSDDRFGSYSESAPRNTLHVLMTQHFAETWDASLTFHQQSAYKPIGVPAVQQGFSRVDIRVARNFPFERGTAEVALVVENLFDRHYTEFRPENFAERRAWLTVGVKF